MYCIWEREVPFGHEASELITKALSEYMLPVFRLCYQQCGLDYQQSKLGIH
jgi:hypothetical protein